MPIAAAPLIAAGASLVGQAGSAYAQGKTNLKTRQFAEEMYFRQRADALSDWERTLPKNQMRYLEEAGLNPNLVYGNGAQATEAPRGAPSQSWNPKAPEFDGSSPMRAYTDTKMSMAQQDMMNKQKAVMDQEIELKRAQTIFQNVQSETGTFDLNLKNALKNYNLEAAELNNQKTATDIDAKVQEMGINLNKQQLAIAAQEKDFAVAAKQMALIDSQMATNEVERKRLNTIIQGEEFMNKVKEAEAKLAKDGIFRGDPQWVKMLDRVLNWFKEKQDNTPGQPKTSGEKYNPKQPKYGGYDSTGKFIMPNVGR